jgi:hypothetical protein
MPDPRVYENASVLFIDIVSYSKQTVDQQAKLIGLLQTAVNQSPEFQAAHETDLIKLPPGDGMAQSLTRNLLAPVQCALEITESIRTTDELKVRIGIHTGPITRQQDINGKVNIVAPQAVTIPRPLSSLTSQPLATNAPPSPFTQALIYPCRC